MPHRKNLLLCVVASQLGFYQGFPDVKRCLLFFLPPACLPACQVQQHWFNYTIKMDKMMEEALRLNVKWSLMELSKAINGDGKSSPSPLFRVKVILQDNYPNIPQVSPLRVPLVSTCPGLTREEPLISGKAAALHGGFRPNHWLAASWRTSQNRTGERPACIRQDCTRGASGLRVQRCKAAARGSEIAGEAQ